MHPRYRTQREETRITPTENATNALLSRLRKMASLTVCSRGLAVSKVKEALLNGVQKSISRFRISPLMLQNVPRLNHELLATVGNYSSTCTVTATTSVTESIFSLLDRIIPSYHSSMNFVTSRSCDSMPDWSTYEVGSSFRFVSPHMGNYYSPSHEIVSDLEALDDYSEYIWLSSTLKKRRTKMNKHKLKKRRKKLRLQNKK